MSGVGGLGHHHDALDNTDFALQGPQTNGARGWGRHFQVLRGESLHVCGLESDCLACGVGDCDPDRGRDTQGRVSSGGAFCDGDVSVDWHGSHWRSRHLGERHQGWVWSSVWSSANQVRRLGLHYEGSKRTICGCRVNCRLGWRDGLRQSDGDTVDVSSGNSGNVRCVCRTSVGVGVSVCVGTSNGRSQCDRPTSSVNSSYSGHVRLLSASSTRGGTRGGTCGSTCGSTCWFHTRGDNRRHSLDHTGGISDNSTCSDQFHPRVRACISLGVGISIGVGVGVCSRSLRSTRGSVCIRIRVCISIRVRLWFRIVIYGSHGRQSTVSERRDNEVGNNSSLSHTGYQQQPRDPHFAC